MLLKVGIVCGLYHSLVLLWARLVTIFFIRNCYWDINYHAHIHTGLLVAFNCLSRNSGVDYKTPICRAVVVMMVEFLDGSGRKLQNQKCLFIYKVIDEWSFTDFLVGLCLNDWLFFKLLFLHIQNLYSVLLF